MSAILVIAWNDVRLFLRDRTAYLWLFVMPLAFVWVMGFAARGPGGGEAWIVRGRDHGVSVPLRSQSSAQRSAVRKRLGAMRLTPA